MQANGRVSEQRAGERAATGNREPCARGRASWWVSALAGGARQPQANGRLSEQQRRRRASGHPAGIGLDTHITLVELGQTRFAVVIKYQNGFNHDDWTVVILRHRLTAAFEAELLRNMNDEEGMWKYGTEFQTNSPFGKALNGDGNRSGSRKAAALFRILNATSLASK